MDSEKDFNVTKMRHFAKLHERIQNKYNEMQKRLEKSKSVDSLATVDDDNLLQKNIKCSSTNDLIDDVFIENVYPMMQTVIVEDVNTIEVTYTDIDLKEASVSESENSVNTVDSNKSDNTEKDDFEHNEEFLNERIFSKDSLNESDKKGDESTSTSPTPKLSIRHRIGSRVSAVRQRRREAKEKKLLNNKSEILETGSKSEKLLFSASSSKSDLRLKDKRFKSATVTIALIEATGLDIDPEERQRTLQCRFRLGVEKYKSKQIKHVTTPTVKWQELFNMIMYDENSNQLEISLLDTDRKDPVIGRTTVDLSILEKEKTHVMNLPLEGSISNAVTILYLLTISGSPFDDLVVDAQDYQEYQTRLKAEDKDYGIFQLNDLFTVGRLSVIVYGAKGLALPDCYCCLKLINERRQTQTEYKTNDPNWMKSFLFHVPDITANLLVIVKDERRGDEEIGRVAIPLLQIRNGEKVWYALKDETLRERAKGINPRILLEMRIRWNIIKASARVIKPKEVDFLETEDKFDRKLFFKNIARSKVVMFWTVDFLHILRSCFEWESKKLNTIWLILWLLFNWYFSPFLVPLLLLIPFVWYRPPKYYFIYWKPLMMRSYNNKEESTADPDKEQRKSLRQKINNLQDLIYSVQKFLGKLANFGESVKNLCNFTVPYLSFLAIFFIISISVFLYIFPTRYILMGWGIKKYVRKIIWPNRVPHSEVMDLISRVPNDEDLADCEMLPLELTSKDRLHDKDEEDVFHDIFRYEEDDDREISEVP